MEWASWMEETRACMRGDSQLPPQNDPSFHARYDHVRRPRPRWRFYANRVGACVHVLGYEEAGQNYDLQLGGRSYVLYQHSYFGLQPHVCADAFIGWTLCRRCRARS